MRYSIFVFSLLATLYSNASLKDDIKVLHESAYTLLDTNKDSALLISINAEQMAKKAKLVWEEANSIFIQAWIQSYTNRSGDSFHQYIRALSLLKSHLETDIQNQKLYLKMSRNVGLLLSNHGAFPQALRFLDSGLDIALHKGYTSEAANFLCVEAAMYCRKKDFHNALVTINAALEYHDIDEKTLFKIWNQKGLILINQNRIGESREYFRRIIERTTGNSDYQYQLAQAVHNIGYSYFSEERYCNALVQLESSDSIFMGTGYNESYFQLLNDLTEANFRLKNYSNTNSTGFRALELYHHAELTPDNYSLFTTLSKSYAALGNYQEAQKYAEMYMAENEKYLKTQEMLMKVREEFHMEELTARFFMSIDDVQDKSLYWIILSIISSSFTIILLAGMTKNHLAKRALKKSLQEISRDSW